MTKYAVVLTGGHQYWVEEGRTIEVEKLPAFDSKEVKLNEVLLVRENGKSQIGLPYVKDASIICEVVENIRAPKVISFKFKRRKGYRRKVGHRQTLTRLRVKSIQTVQAE